MSGTGSTRHICQLLELAGLDQFIASSYGSQYDVCVKMEQAITKFDHIERERLSATMPQKEITVCQDETFHPETCLVAIEPVSNFILLEKYADSRKASEWTKAMEEATRGLPVTVVQSTSDEGKGILHHVKTDLGAHHSPDVFHVQHEIVKGTSAVLAGKKKKRESSWSRPLRMFNPAFGRRKNIFRPHMDPDVPLNLTKGSKNPCGIKKRP